MTNKWIFDGIHIDAERVSHSRLASNAWGITQNAVEYTPDVERAIGFLIFSKWFDLSTKPAREEPAPTLNDFAKDYLPKTSIPERHRKRFWNDVIAKGREISSEVPDCLKHGTQLPQVNTNRPFRPIHRRTGIPTYGRSRRPRHILRTHRTGTPAHR